MPSIDVIYEDGALHAAAATFAERHGLSCTPVRDDDCPLHLVFTKSQVFIEQVSATPKSKSVLRISVDFVGGKNNYRRQHGGGRGQALVKAVGASAKFQPCVLDATAGMGEDAFVLASLGCAIQLYERVPAVHCILQDGLQRLRDGDEQVHRDIGERMHLHPSDFLSVDLSSIPAPDVVYLDPMFPLREKSAKVKKEMQVFHALVAADNDSDELLDRALSLAKYRVVVKRPVTAPHLMHKKPSHIIPGKTTRFDIYTRLALPQ